MYVCRTSMIGVEIREEALMISFRRETPKVTFIDATPTGMYVCMYVCMYVWMNEWMYVCKYVFIFTYMYEFMYV